uniref:Leucine rich immune protein (Coil-less) n=1 Tax=Anopheles dirus TaxID=7168 RepID=A0A182NFA9_9DIPT
MSFPFCSVLCRLVLLLTPCSIAAFQFKCADMICTISKWTPSEDGTFLLDHVPDENFVLRLLHLKTDSLNVGMLSKVIPVMGTVNVENSPVKSVTLPASSNVTFLWVRRTHLSEITFEKDNVQLENLGIAKSRLKSVPATVVHLEAVKAIRIVESHLSTVNLNVFGTLRRLEQLDLSRNKIGFLHLTVTGPDAFPRLNSLFFTGNRLVTVSLHPFNVMPALETLDFATNRIVRVQGRLLSATMATLNLGQNRLSAVSCCGWNVSALSNLQLNNNNLEELPVCMEEAIPNITTLNLMSNALSNSGIWDRLLTLRRLIVLNVSYNRLTSAVFCAEWVAMQNLDMSHNRIRHLRVPLARQGLDIDVGCNLVEEFDLDDISRNVSTLYMHGNPIDCGWNGRELGNRGENAQCKRANEATCS